jgi:hypothetical protein
LEGDETEVGAGSYIFPFFVLFSLFFKYPYISSPDLSAIFFIIIIISISIISQKRSRKDTARLDILFEGYQMLQMNSFRSFFDR